MPRRSLGALGALLLIPAIALAACGGRTPVTSSEPATAPSDEAPVATEATSPESPATGGGIEGTLTPGTDLSACEIVTSDDIAVATKVVGTVAPGALEASPTVLSPARSECTYEGDYGRIIVELTPDDGENLYDAAAGAYKDAAPITGIGDGAFNSDDNHRAFIWQDKVTVMLTMFVGGDVTQLQVATDLGNAIIAKL